MPILAREIDVFPDDLLDTSLGCRSDERWWTLYTLSRREKQLMRCLLRLEIKFYAPIIPKRFRSPNGRIRNSFVPLFPGYVFVYGDAEQRQLAMTSNCVSRCLAAPDGDQLRSDLLQIRHLIEIGEPLTVESRIEAGQFVRVRSGMFAGFEGTVIRRQNKTRLVVAVRFIQQGVSVLLEDCQVEPV